VFGYGSLVELGEPLVEGDRVYPAMPGRLRGFRRFWGAAMNNWEASDAQKHFVDPDSGLKPRLKVAYLDIEERPGSIVNGLAIPVDPTRLAELDLREINYRRIDVSTAFEPATSQRVFAYVGTPAARARARIETPGAAIHVSRQYVSRIRRAFAALGGDELAEFERTTEPLRFPERELEPRYPPPPAPP
jgi:hypothetical protein